MRQQLTILEPFVPIFNAVSLRILWGADELDESNAMLKALPPNIGSRSVLFARIYAAQGRYGEAADSLLSNPGSDELRPVIELSARILRAAPKLADKSFPRLGGGGWVYLYVGAPEHALDDYQERLDIGWTGGDRHSYLWGRPYAGVRKSDRFKDYVRAAGMVDYWRAKGWPDLCHPVGADDFACE